jgi:hypothetical protein
MTWSRRPPFQPRQRWGELLSGSDVPWSCSLAVTNPSQTPREVPSGADTGHRPTRAARHQCADDLRARNRAVASSRMRRLREMIESGTKRARTGSF